MTVQSVDEGYKGLCDEAQNGEVYTACVVMWQARTVWW